MASVLVVPRVRGMARMRIRLRAFGFSRSAVAAMSSVLIRILVRMMMRTSVLVALRMRHAGPRVDGACAAVQFMLHKMTGKPHSSQTPMTRSHRTLGRLSIALAVTLPAATQVLAQAAPSSTAAADSTAVTGVVHAYHRALSTGDSTSALALLASDAVILESGGVESRDEYRSHHLPADVQFAKGVPSERTPIHVRVVGDAAWAWSTSTSQGEFRGRQVNSAGAELMVLQRVQGTWRIAAIHWSSRTRCP